MKKNFLTLLSFLIIAIALQGCQDNDDVLINPKSINLQINNFIWKGLNLMYFWQTDVPNLADNRFANETELDSFLSTYTNPEALFNALRIDKSIDRFSWIVSDYIELEGQLQGTTKNNGIEFGLSYKPGSSTDIIGYVRYIIPNSDAAGKNIKRGEIFYAVNGTPLTISNYASLLFSSAEIYTLNFATFDGVNFTPNGKTLEFTKTVLDENPILINTVITSGTHKIGYLMYNGFYSNYDTKLNDAFGTLKSQNITDLVLDLRYNGGGSVQTATRLASMITGQFSNQLFTKLKYNEINQRNNNDYLFPNNIGSTAINSLNMTKVYILTTAGTASASELIINGLKPYITVVHIGDVTSGKNVASVTLYDSPDFSKKNRNPNHRYAMQPIVASSVNANGFGDYQTGIVPDFKLKESVSTYGVLGNPSEPLLNLAIGKITGTAKISKQDSSKLLNYFTDSKAATGRNEMYIE